MALAAQDMPPIQAGMFPEGKRAACRNCAQINFYNTDDVELVRAAKRVCFTECMVQAECLRYALENNEPEWIWGGLTPEERERFGNIALREPRAQYSGLWLITLLWQIFFKENRPPKHADLRCSKGWPSVRTYDRYFGSFNNALTVAGFKQNHPQGYTREVLITQLQTLARNLGRSPTTFDIKAASKRGTCASDQSFKQHFGSLNKALQEAGLPITRQHYYTDEELLQQLRNVSEELGAVPTAQQMHNLHKIGKCAGLTVFLKRFGSLNKALKAAGLKVARQNHYTDAELLEQLRGLTQLLGHHPTYKDMIEAARRKDCAAYVTFCERFGSLDLALDMIKTQAA